MDSIASGPTFLVWYIASAGSFRSLRAAGQHRGAPLSIITRGPVLWTRFYVPAHAALPVVDGLVRAARGSFVVGLASAVQLRERGQRQHVALPEPDARDSEVLADPAGRLRIVRVGALRVGGRVPAARQAQGPSHHGRA